MKRPSLRKVFTRPKAVSPELRDALDQLDALARQRPSLSQTVAVLREVLPTAYEASSCEVVGLARCAAVGKLQNATPLLRGERVSLDEHFRDRWQTICKAVQRHQTSASGSQQIAGLLNQQDWNVEQLVYDVLAGHVQDIRSRAETAGLDAELLTTVLRLTLFSTLSRVAMELAAWIAEVRWPHGFCPVCGSWPLLGEFRGLEQTRYLRCGLCACEWEYPRLECPFCATRDHKLLGYFHVEGEETKYRVSTCDGCQSYVKTVFTLSALSPLQLLVTDLATMHLDLAALDR